MSTSEHPVSRGDSPESPAIARNPRAQESLSQESMWARPRSRTQLLHTTGLHLLLVAIATTLVLPFVWMLLTSLKPLDEVQSSNWIPSSVHWRKVTLKLPASFEKLFDTENWREIGSINLPANYVNVFAADNPDPNNAGIPFARYYWNSIFVASWVTFLQVLTSAMAAYSFSRLHWPGRDRVFLLYLSTMMLPGLVMMIPNYQIMISLGLVDTLLGLIIPASFSAFGTFLLRQFMLTIPSSLDEAAEIDGASRWRIFWDIILPLARPGLIALTIFTFLGNYQSFFWPLVMLKSVHKYTLPVGLLAFDSSRGQTTHLLMAAVTMSVLPLIVLFVVLQKYLVRGIQLGAVKG